MPQAFNRPPRSWDGIAQEITQETDLIKLHILLTKLNDAMLTEAREQVRQRFKCLGDGQRELKTV
jgi:hypothetical protein